MERGCVVFVEKVKMRERKRKKKKKREGREMLLCFL